MVLRKSFSTIGRVTQSASSANDTHDTSEPGADALGEETVSFGGRELEYVELRRSLRGYDRAEIDQLLADMSTRYEQLWRDRAELQAKVDELTTESVRQRERVEEMTAEAACQRERVEEMTAATARHRELEHELRETLRSVEQAAEELEDELRGRVQTEDEVDTDYESELEHARARAVELLGVADAERQRVEARVRRLQDLEHDFRESYRAVLTSALERLEREGSGRATAPRPPERCEPSPPRPAARPRGRPPTPRPARSEQSATSRLLDEIRARLKLDDVRARPPRRTS